MMTVVQRRARARIVNLLVPRLHDFTGGPAANEDGGFSSQPKSQSQKAAAALAMVLTASYSNDL